MAVAGCSHCLMLQLSKTKIRQTKLKYNGENEVLPKIIKNIITTYYSKLIKNKVCHGPNKANLWALFGV